MQKNSQYCNTEINCSVNRWFIVFSLYNFTRSNPRITYILLALKIKKIDKMKKNTFYEKRKKNVIYIYVVSVVSSGLQWSWCMQMLNCGSLLNCLNTEVRRGLRCTAWCTCLLDSVLIRNIQSCCMFMLDHMFNLLPTHIKQSGKPSTDSSCWALLNDYNLPSYCSLFCVKCRPSLCYFVFYCQLFHI